MIILLENNRIYLFHEKYYVYEYLIDSDLIIFK